MAGWFDGLFQGAAEIENRFAREDGGRDPRPRSGNHPDYVAGFKQGVHDARAVAAFRKAEEVRQERCRSREPGLRPWGRRT
jgi:hypothetical protein